VASIKIMLKSSLINALLKAEKNTDFSNKIGEFLQKSGRRLNDLLQFLCSQNNGKELGRFQDDVPGLSLFRSLFLFPLFHLFSISSFILFYLYTFIYQYVYKNYKLSKIITRT
jgi:hypothetical protein